MSQLVRTARCSRPEPFAARRTLERPFVRVRAHVRLQRALLREGTAANVTPKRSYSIVPVGVGWNG